ncbi:hypothetical protein SELMODRAFT_75909 [Selaginella moellendorffii]|uniref:Pentacotripeptide-repeat region of PRORP domain-containing protein n=2 Tax=Selaginella moellendorffii TaxID=88036 RepID=D8QPA3_SELML|nr:hypothetical protein SELMODRAFT_75909 [Selaginella moellendorffii]
MIQAYAQSGHGFEALELYHEMLLCGVMPDEASFKSVMVACSYVGMLHDTCHALLVSMASDFDVALSKDHFNCIADMLGRSGQLDRAEEFVHSMPVPPLEKATAWSALLGNCKLQQDAERAARVAEHALELNPGDSATYILLANLFASSGRLQDDMV